MRMRHPKTALFFCAFALSAQNRVRNISNATVVQGQNGNSYAI